MNDSTRNVLVKCLGTVLRAACILMLTAGSSATAQSGGVVTIKITPANPTMQVGQSLTFTAQGYDAQGQPVQIVDPRWSVDDRYGYGSVDPNDPSKFIFTATNPGTGGVACSEGPPFQGGPHGSTDLNILPQDQLFRIDVTPSNVNLRI
ncbi:MAG: hypothetical protein ACUVQG_14985, partial [Thermogutta sp.]